MIANQRFPFAGKKADSPVLPNRRPWKVLVVDDDPEVHTITNAVLRTLVFEQRGLVLLNAHSAAEAKALLAEHQDTALILLDVVMENDYAGLELVRHIREQCGNRLVQIVLRTGQPGYAPETEVIREYEINDYKEKTELTAARLHTLVLTALRAYRNLRNLEKNRIGLTKIIDSTKSLFEHRSEKAFLEGVLTQLEALLHLDEEALMVRHSAFSAFHHAGSGYVVLAATGTFDGLRVPPPELYPYLDRALNERRSFFADDIFVEYTPINERLQNLILFKGCRHLSPDSRTLIELFASKVAIALKNLELYKEIYDSDREAITTLSNVLEHRSLELGNHIQRMAEFSRLLARAAGLAEDQVELLYRASPMHDIGKVGVPDAVLLKPGLLTDRERQLMKRHTEIGYRILGGSERQLFRAAALIAHQHHEHFDGNGYPQGLAGEDIHVFARITAVADVFDALYHRRCYKEPWPLARILDYFHHQRGRQFDPQIADLLLAEVQALVALSERIG